MQDQLAPSQRDPGLMASWYATAALAIGLTIICVVFWREMKSAIEVWNASTAYSHCYLVLPMAMYLVWERREVVRTARVVPDLRFAVAAIPLTAFWLVAERLGIMETRQLAVVAAIQLLFLTVLGRTFFIAISGPLLFLFFLVPFGAFLTPALQQFTATFSIVGLDLLGIPNFSDKFTIETPAGVFFVAEACAGLRFLIAAIAFGVFYALLSYTDLKRRAAFIALSIVVPILANGIRALGIIVLGQVLGSAQAAAADHLIYGWVFFSAVMLLLIAGGQLFREVDQPVSAGQALPPLHPRQSPFWCVACVIVLLGIGPAVAGAIDSTSITPVLPTMATIAAPSGCSSDNRGESSSADQRMFTIVCGGDRFDVSLHAFAARSTSSAMISERRRVSQEIGAENSVVSSIDVPDGAGQWTIVQTTDPNRLTAYASWVDGLPVPNGIAGRIAQARDSILGSAYVPALITITTAEPANSLPGQRKSTLDKLTSLLREQTALNSRMTTLTHLSD